MFIIAWFLAGWAMLFFFSRIQKKNRHTHTVFVRLMKGKTKDPHEQKKSGERKRVSEWIQSFATPVQQVVFGCVLFLFYPFPSDHKKGIFAALFGSIECICIYILMCKVYFWFLALSRFIQYIRHRSLIEQPLSTLQNISILFLAQFNNTMIRIQMNGTFFFVFNVRPLHIFCTLSFSFFLTFSLSLTHCITKRSFKF